MIITLISLGLLILGIMLYQFSDNEFCELNVGVGSIVIGMISITICLFYILTSHIGVNHKIEEFKIKYESLNTKIECINNDYEDVSKSQIIDDVYGWNIGVYNYKYYSQNLWINWFNSKKFADSLEYIDAERIK